MGTKISLLGAGLMLMLLAQAANAQNTVALPPIDVSTSRLGGVAAQALQTSVMSYR